MAAYYVWSAAVGSANGTSWANAYTTLTTAFSGKVAGDVFYVAHDHAESTAAAISLVFSAGTAANPGKVICVNRSGSVPPVSADRRATAQVATPATGGNITLSGFTHYDGVIFLAGTATGGADIRIGGVALGLRFDNCSLRIVTTNTGSRIQVGSASGISANYIEFNNTTVSFAAVGQGVVIGAWLRWRNTPSALLNTIPTVLFYSTSVLGGGVECIGVDFSAAGSGKTIVGAATSVATAQTFNFVDCKLNASVTKSTAPSAHGSIEVNFVRSSATGNVAVYRHRTSGELMEETAIVRTGGALG